MALDLTFQPFSGVGIVTMFPRASDGSLGAGFDLGQAPVFKISHQVPTLELNSSRDVARGVAFRMGQRKVANLEIQLRTINDFTLGLLTGGSFADVAADSAVVGWEAPDDLVVGSVIKLPHKNVSAVTVTDSTGSPLTLLVAGYELDAVGGTITLKDITTGGPYTQPFKVGYTPGATKVIGALKAAETEYTVQLNGTNAYNGERVIVEGFNFRFTSEGDRDWISEEFGTYTLNGSLLIDETRSASGISGQYYSITKPGA